MIFSRERRPQTLVYRPIIDLSSSHAIIAPTKPTMPILKQNVWIKDEHEDPFKLVYAPTTKPTFPILYENKKPRGFLKKFLNKTRHHKIHHKLQKNYKLTTSPFFKDLTSMGTTVYAPEPPKIEFNRLYPTIRDLPTTTVYRPDMPELQFNGKYRRPFPFTKPHHKRFGKK